MDRENFEQLLLQDIWKYLSYTDLISFSRSSQRYLKLLTSSHIWIYLLQRDFSFSLAESDPAKLRNLYEYKYLLPDSYLHLSNHDQILKHRLYRFIYSQPTTNITYWCFNKNYENLLVATITGANIYEVILKYIIHIELPQLNFPGISTPLWRYLKTHDQLYAQIESRSLGDVLAKLIPSFTSSTYNPYLVLTTSIPVF